MIALYLQEEHPIRNRNPHYKLTAYRIAAFKNYLCAEEREQSTIEKHLCNIRACVAWLGEHIGHKARRHSMEGVFAGGECKIKALRLQRQVFRNPNRELTRDEYDHLVSTADEFGKIRLGLLMETVETICVTGVRMSEVKYITVEVAQCGKAEIFLKGKIRTIMLPGKLCRKLLKYTKKQEIVFGAIFLTRNGKDCIGGISGQG